MYQKHQTKYPLSGKLYCEKHECGFVRKIRYYKDKKDVTFWYCSDFHKTGKKRCAPACFKEEELYDILLSVFKTYEIYKEEICEELLSFYQDLSKTEENIEKENKLQIELDVLRKRQDKLLDLALDGLLSKEDLLSKKVIIEKQIEQIKLKLKEIESKKAKVEDKKQYDKMLKENITKELDITKENLENYIEELLDKIIVIEKENMKEVELKIILAGNKIINIGSLQEPRQISQIVQNKKTDYKKIQLCHSHAHGKGLLS